MVAPKFKIQLFQIGLMDNGKDSFCSKNHSKQKRASFTSQFTQPITDHPKRRETVTEYLARGGTITAQPAVRTITWREAQDLLEKLAWHNYVPPKPVDNEEE
tara:strand:+ start:1707 stop:2012 length:306 start_codon:yes stop_codon:yes gene_type:complete